MGLLAFSMQVLGLLSWVEIIGLMIIVLVLFFWREMPDAMHGLGRTLRRRSDTPNTADDPSPSDAGPETAPGGTGRSPLSSLILYLARGFNVGRLPFAPGLFGSLVGLLWFFLLLLTQNFWLYLAGALLGVGLSVWLCGLAERILREKDPSSIVLDEIVAMPFCFLAWVASDWFRRGQWPVPDSFFTSRTWLATTILFVLFRVVDVLKPWPVRQSQRLPGGWGVTVDDVLAAFYVALVSLLFVG